MRKGMWVIAVMGFLALVIVVVFMLFSLLLFQQSPAAQRTQLAQLVQSEFRFDVVAADVRDVFGRNCLFVAYETSADSKFDRAVQKAEMERVAKFAQDRYDGQDRARLDELRIRRREIRHRGCWSRADESEHVVQRPQFTPLRGPDGKPMDREGRFRLR